MLDDIYDDFNDQYIDELWPDDDDQESDCYDEDKILMEDDNMRAKTDISHMRTGELMQLCSEVNNEMSSRRLAWKEYIKYLHDWADSHEDMSSYQMSPVSFDEFCDNEYCLDKEA